MATKISRYIFSLIPWRRNHFFSHLEEFIQEESQANGWAESTIRSWRSFTVRIKAFNPTAGFSFFDETGINKFITFLKATGVEDKTVQKQFRFLKWYIGWALRKGYTKEDTVRRIKPKFRLPGKPVVFLTKEELMHLFRFSIPSNGTIVRLTDMYGKGYEKMVKMSGGLAKARDLFCFCAFTSLRYSDMAALKRTDIKDGTIYITTVKTYESLPITLNKFAMEILDKYRGCDFPGGKALPVIPNQLMNRYLKCLCELAGFNTPITRTCYRGGERVEETFPKYKLIGTHAGRRSFICFALASGIPPQVVMKWTGHSDYRAMKPYIEVAEKTKAEAMHRFEEAMSSQMF